MSNNEAEKIFIKLDDREVLSVGNKLDFNSYFNSPIISSNQLQAYLKACLKIENQIKSALFDEGMEGEVLRFDSQGWQTGKIRVKIAVEFCPDEPEVEETPENNDSETSQPESPLDDLRRQLLNQENQPNNS